MVGGCTLGYFFNDGTCAHVAGYGNARARLGSLEEHQDLYSPNFPSQKKIHAVGYPPVREKGFVRFFSPTVAPMPPKIIHHNTSMIRSNFYLQDLL
jgi:hypothetical protein